MTIEILFFVALVGFLMFMGASSILFQAYAGKKPSKWAYKVASSCATSTSQFTPLELANSTKLATNSAVYENSTNLVTFSELHSHENSNVGIASNHSVLVFENNNNPEFMYSKPNEETINNILQLASEMEIHSPVSGLSEEEYEMVEILTDESVAKLITASIGDIPVGEQCIIGYFEIENGKKYMKFNGNKVEVSSDSQRIWQAHGELVIAKGQLLPNGTFRVLNSEDPHMLMHGYTQDFDVFEKELAN